MTTSISAGGSPESRTPPGRRLLPLCALLAMAMVGGCANRPNRAPVEERSPTSRVSVAAASPAVEAVPALVKTAPDAGKAGTYTVKPGDTLIRIGLDNGQNWKDIVRWNNLTNPNLIEVGQVLRVVAPGTDPAAASSRAVTTARVETRPLDARPGDGRPVPPAQAASPVPLGTPAALQPPVVVTPPPATPLPKDGDDDVAWAWPVAATAPQPYDESRNKGLVFKGKAGDAVLAAADGRVVYAGSGLRGYGNLVILKHNATYLTAYAHNQKLLVKEDDTVRRGQKIAEMGATDADGVQLHFEVRRQGKPIDPTRVLPAR